MTEIKKPFTLGSEKGSISFCTYTYYIYIPKSLPAAPCSRIIIRLLSRLRLIIFFLYLFKFGCKVITFFCNKQTFCYFFD